MNGEIAITVIATGFPVMTTAEASKGTYVITLVHSLITSFMPEINCFEEEFVNSYSLHQNLDLIDSFCCFIDLPINDIFYLCYTLSPSLFFLSLPIYLSIYLSLSNNFSFPFFLFCFCFCHS